MKTLLSLSTLSVSLLTVALPLGATTITVTYGVTATRNTGATTETFESGLQLPANFVSRGDNVGVLAAGTVLNDVYIPPSGDDSNYAFVSVSSSLEEVFGAPILYFGLDWGSPDSYNTLTLTDVHGGRYSYSPGTTLAGLRPDQTTGAFVEFVADVPWVSATFQSDGPSFEFDNVATSSPSPEPSTTLLFGAGFLALGVVRRGKIGPLLLARSPGWKQTVRRLLTIRS
jgi:hypothetical protein